MLAFWPERFAVCWAAEGDNPPCLVPGSPGSDEDGWTGQWLPLFFGVGRPAPRLWVSGSSSFGPVGGGLCIVEEDDVEPSWSVHTLHP